MGLLAAVEMWVRRDHEAEFNTWIGWLNEMATSVKRILGVTTELRKPIGMSNHSPLLVVQWDSGKLGITGEEVYRHLYNGDPRIVGFRHRKPAALSYLTVLPWQMQAENLPWLSRRFIVFFLIRRRSNRSPRPAVPRRTSRAAGNCGWNSSRGVRTTCFSWTKMAKQIVGRHEGEITAGDLSGWVDGKSTSGAPTAMKARASGSISVASWRATRCTEFADLGEYGSADWLATRYEYSETPRGRDPGASGACGRVGLYRDLHAAVPAWCHVRRVRS